MLVITARIGRNYKLQTKMIKIAYDQNIVAAEKFLSPVGTLTPFDGRALTRASLPECDALLVRSVTKVNESLLSESGVTFVGTATAGTDHIDKTWLATENISFASAAGSNATSVAEYVVSALSTLNLVYQTDLTVGVVGYGHVGKEVHRVLDALNISVKVFDPFLKDTLGHSHLSEFEDLYDVDVLTLHTPLTQNDESQYPTYHMIDEDVLRNFKDGLTLINSARGGVIKEKDLLLLHGENKFNAIVLDVFENEPTPNQDVLSICTLYTPHIAGYSYTGKIRGTAMMLSALKQKFALTLEIEKSECDTQTITYSGEEPNTFINQCIQIVYSITDDFIRAQAIATHLAPSEEFDRQRKKYPMRLECSDYTIQGLPDDLKGPLSKLGFNIS